MPTINVLLLADLLIFTTCSCPGLFWPPPLETRMPEDITSELVGEDRGCICRKVPKFSVCYGVLCRHFPKHVNITSKVLKVKGTRFAHLKVGDLAGLTHLTVLELESNLNLNRIVPGAFLKMSKLTNLSISYNSNLRSLDSTSFEGLTNLKHLFLMKNAFVSLTDITPALSSLLKLLTLNLKENNFDRVVYDSFEVMRGSSLKELDLALCQIENIEPSAFNPLTNLTVLRLGENSVNVSALAAMIEQVTNHTPLAGLALDAIGLRKAPPTQLMSAIAATKITALYLSRNQFEVLNRDSFPLMLNLEFLDLTEVSALNVTKDAFVHLPNLKTLFLSGNKLSTIPEGMALNKVNYLDLRQNSGDSRSPVDFALTGRQFTNMKKLKCIDLSFNTINALQKFSFEGLTHLQVLELMNGTIYNIVSGAFAALPNLQVLNLQNNFFVKNHGPVWQQGMFQDLVKLKVLLLGGCGIGFVTSRVFQGLDQLQYLGLERNKLVTVEGFGALAKLRALDLSQNVLLAWNVPVFAQNPQLAQLRLSDNKLTYLSSPMLHDFGNLTVLELVNNPFTCDCQLAWNQEVAGLVADQKVVCAFPESTNLTVEEYLRTRECHNLTLVVPLVVMAILAVTTALLLFYLRWHLRYWLFLTRLYLSRKRKIRNKETRGNANYAYDAFVSYSNEDRSFVVTLVAMLEDYPPFIKLCVYERDFEVGTMISENVLESVAKSRKTLLVISDSYAKSQWCRWETQIAEHHRLFFQDDNGEYVDDSLILIKLGPINEAHLTPTLKYLLKTRIYLQWEVDDKKQKVFWEKLRATLAPLDSENTYL